MATVLEAGKPVTAVFGSHRVFVSWLRSLSGLRTFWTRSLKDVAIVSREPLALEASWRARRGCGRAFFVVSSSFSHVYGLRGEVKGVLGGSTSITCYMMVTTLDLDPSVSPPS